MAEHEKEHQKKIGAVEEKPKEEPKKPAAPTPAAASARSSWQTASTSITWNASSWLGARDLDVDWRNGLFGSGK